jgi:hypothetical protein
VPSEEGRSDATRTVVAVAVLIAATAGLLALASRDSGDTAARPPKTAAEDGSVQGLDPAQIQTVIPRDGIPAIDEPHFDAVSDVDWLADEEPVVALEVDGDARAYPLQIMTWHEIVNDKVGGVPVAVTFCPLCNTALAFERPVISGDATTFGTSGKLINSNLLMYDRATESLWPQVTGIALTGELKGMELRRIPAQIVSWAQFRASFPDGLVLNRDTGHSRQYGTNPYPGYDDVDRPPFLFEGEVDGRLAAVERILGVKAGDEAVAFPYFRLEEAATDGVAAVDAEVGDRPVVIMWRLGTASALDSSDIASSKDVGSIAAFSRRLGGRTLSFTVAGDEIVDRETETTWTIFGRGESGTLEGKALEPVDSTDSFWFDWAAFHPDTDVWGGG